MARRTGDTTRVLFEMLSKPPGTTYFFISRDLHHARHVYCMFKEILEKLNFPYSTNVTELSIENAGRTYIFTSAKMYSVRGRLRENLKYKEFFDDYSYLKEIK